MTGKNLTRKELGYDPVSRDDCIEWEGVRNVQGYGKKWIRSKKTTKLVHRLEWPSLPAGATSWTVSRLQFYTRNPPGVGDAIWVQLRPPDMSGLPTPTVLEQHYAVIGDLWIWHEENFNDIPPWPADQGLCLVVSWAGGESPAKLRYTVEDVDRLLTTDGGATWVRSSGDSLLYAVYGTYTEDVMTPITYLTGIRIKLRTGPDPTTRVETSVPLLHVHDITP